MIFIATGADASANNLGKISIKAISEIQADTVTKLNFFGKTWTDDQKIAFDDFLVAFNAASWKSKVKVISMPILIPIQNQITGTAISASGSKFKKNIADWGNEMLAESYLIDATYGYAGISQNGLVLQNNNVGGTPNANSGVEINTTSFGITNKSLHYGCYYKSNTKFRAGSPGGSAPHLTSTLITDDSNCFNNLRITSNTISSAKKQLLILNGDVTIPASKSFVKNTLVATTIINTQASAVQTNAGLIKSGSDNIVNDSTACFMTFGNYMTDAELLEYGGLINTLMDVLIV